MGVFCVRVCARACALVEGKGEVCARAIVVCMQEEGSEALREPPQWCVKWEHKDTGRLD
jgi:hypothetical protein